MRPRSYPRMGAWIGLLGTQCCVRACHPLLSLSNDSNLWVDCLVESQKDGNDNRGGKGSKPSNPKRPRPQSDGKDNSLKNITPSDKEERYVCGLCKLVFDDKDEDEATFWIGKQGEERKKMGLLSSPSWSQLSCIVSSRSRLRQLLQVVPWQVCQRDTKERRAARKLHMSSL